MSSIIQAICWAVLILGVAFAGRAELLPPESARTLTIVLPALAVVSILKSRACAKLSAQRDRA